MPPASVFYLKSIQRKCIMYSYIYVVLGCIKNTVDDHNVICAIYPTFCHLLYALYEFLTFRCNKMPNYSFSDTVCNAMK